MLVNYRKFTNYIAIAVQSFIKQILEKCDCDKYTFFIRTSKRH